MFPANIRLDEDVFCLCLQKTFSRLLDQDEYIRLSHTSSEDVFKTSSRRLGEDQHIRLDHTSSRRFQDVFKTFSRRLQNVFKMSCKNVFKTSSRLLQDVLQRCFQAVFNTYHQVKLFLLTGLRDAFNTFLRRTAKRIIYRRICLGHTFDKFMVSVQNLQE